MPPEKTTPRWKKILGYASFAVFSFLIGLLATFPYDTLKKVISSNARAQGYDLKIKSLGPGLGITASGIRLSKLALAQDTKPPEALEIDRVSFRPSLFPPGLSVKASLMGGSVSVVTGLGRLQLEADDIDFSKGNFKGFSGVDLEGTLKGSLSLSFPGMATEYDLGKSNGAFRLNMDGLKVNGGTMKVVIPAFGTEPTPVDLPKFELGDLSMGLKIEKGVATAEKVSLLGKGIEVSGSGTLKLAKVLAYSELGLELKTKTTPEFQNTLGVYGMAFSQLRPDPKDPNWRMARLTGYLGRPAFR